MNGKQAKMLRRMQRDSKADKRLFNGMDAKTKGALREAITTHMNHMKLAERPSDSTGEIVAEPVQVTE